MENIWTESGVIAGSRSGYLSFTDLRNHPVNPEIKFVVANIGDKLGIAGKSIYEFWKTDLKNHLVSNIEMISG